MNNEGVQRPESKRTNPLEPFLSERGYAVLDGALATELERNGADLRDPLWSAKLLIENPALIRLVHLAYLHAGADIICTASYQATLEGFMARGMPQQSAADLLRLSVELAVEARAQFWTHAENRIGRMRPLVASSIGPYGAYLADGSEYRGDYALSEKELTDFHRPRLEILAGTAADILAFETIPSLAEGKAIVKLLEEFPGQYAWIAFSCRDGRHVCHGELLAECAAIVGESTAVVAVGANCTAPEHIESLIVEATGATDKPIVVYPNSGEEWDSARGEWTESAGGSSLGAWSSVWRRSGARLIGGCCRTTPEDIAEVRVAMQALR